LNISTSSGGSHRSQDLPILLSVGAAGTQKKSRCDDDEDGPGDSGEETVPLEQE
jgi:hypothetical protein